MSEPTSGGNEPDDPTAPVWADPTAPIPAPPAPPGAAPLQDQQPAANPQGTPPAPPPMSNPYAQPPPAQPYGQPMYQYGQPQPGQHYPAYGQQPYPSGPPAETNASAIVLTIVSALATMSTCAIGIPSLVFGIMALTSNSTDPVGSRKKAKTGWIIFAINVAVVVGIGVILAIILFATSSGSSNTNVGY